MSDPSGDTRDYIEHARWLLEWHNKRSEALTTRAVGLLGFTGVILALLLQGAGIKTLDPTWVTWGIAVVTAGLIFASAIFALWCITTTSVEMPSVEELRAHWKTHMDNPVAGSGVPDMAEGLLNGSDLQGVSPVVAAKNEADTRAGRIKVAVILLLLGVAAVAVLAGNVLANTGGR